MNNANLHELINRYSNSFELLNNKEHEEFFKWQAVQQFHSVWFSPEAKVLSFSRLFNEAKKKCSVLIDNTQVSSTNGIVKLAEKKPAEVESLFRDVLLADDYGDIALRQQHMEDFLIGMEVLRQQVFPQCWKYKQDRHAASCYMSFVAPEQNYIYRYSEAEAFARYTEFGQDLGSGATFSLPNYYRMCDAVVDALKQHDNLLEKHFALLDDTCYHDESLHILAFDVIYCSRTYRLFDGLSHRPKNETLKKYNIARLHEKEEREKAEQIAEIDRQIEEAEIQCAQFEGFSLLGVEVKQKTYGTGTIVWQQGSRIRVRFADFEKEFAINRKYAMRPTFEDDEDVVDAYTKLDSLEETIAALRKNRSRILG